jgi:hypothetical protein
MCENPQPQVGQYDLVALTKEEQKLLKAAPKMLEMLRLAYSTIAMLAPTRYGYPDSQAIQDRLPQIQNAIDKAKS